MFDVTAPNGFQWLAEAGALRRRLARWRAARRGAALLRQLEDRLREDAGLGAAPAAPEIRLGAAPWNGGRRPF